MVTAETRIKRIDIMISTAKENLITGFFLVIRLLKFILLRRNISTITARGTHKTIIGLLISTNPKAFKIMYIKYLQFCFDKENQTNIESRKNLATWEGSEVNSFGLIKP